MYLFDIVESIHSTDRKLFISVRPWSAAVEERTGYGAEDWGSRERVVVFYYLSSGKRVRFSQFAPWPRKMAIGLGNTFTTVPGRVILLRKDFFRFILYRGWNFFRVLTRPFVSLIRSKRLGRLSIFRTRVPILCHSLLQSQENSSASHYINKLLRYYQICNVCNV